MLDKPELSIDWNNGGRECLSGREFVELYCRGTLADIQRLKLVLTEGLEIKISGDDLTAKAIVGRLSERERGR